MSSLEEAFKELAGEEDILDKKMAYEVLCCAGFNPTGLDMAKYWKEHGKAEEDCVTLDEIQELADQLGDPKDVLREAFKYFDKDNNNKIDRDELKEILKSTDVHGSEMYLDDDYIDQTLSLGDTKDGDNMLDIDELIEMITSGILTL